jgi:uncharacterized membrane protein YfcA
MIYRMITLWLSYLLTGVISSFLAGLLGIGGGLVIIPALMFIFTHFNIIPQSELMTIVIGTSLASSITNLLSSIITHQRKGNIRWDIFKRISPWILVGALFFAPYIMSLLSGNHLGTIFGVACFFFSAQMFFPIKKASNEEHLPGNLIMSCLGLIIGTLSTLLGIAGGVMIGTFLNYCEIDIRKVIGTTAAIALVLSLAGTLGLMLTGIVPENTLSADCIGYIYLPALLGIAIPSPFFAPLGIKAAQKLPVATLKKLFATLILVVGIKMLI